MEGVKALLALPLVAALGAATPLPGIPTYAQGYKSWTKLGDRQRSLGVRGEWAARPEEAAAIPFSWYALRSPTRQLVAHRTLPRGAHPDRRALGVNPFPALPGSGCGL
jgi:hypothetical protein